LQNIKAIDFCFTSKQDFFLAISAQTLQLIASIIFSMRFR